GWPVGQHHRLGGEVDPPSDRTGGVGAGREEPTPEQREGISNPAGPVAGRTAGRTGGGSGGGAAGTGRDGGAFREDPDLPLAGEPCDRSPYRSHHSAPGRCLGGGVAGVRRRSKCSRAGGEVGIRLSGRGGSPRAAPCCPRCETPFRRREPASATRPSADESRGSPRRRSSAASASRAGR